MKNMEENCEMIWKKSKLNSEKTWKIQKKIVNDMENIEEK
jgi:hypothetical protein